MGPVSRVRGAHRLSAVLFVAVALMAGACDGDSASSSATSVDGSVPVSTLARPDVPSGSGPVLTVGQFDWFHPVNWLPRDLHSFALYPDGTLIFVDGSTTNNVSLIETSLTTAQVEEILRVADSAGLGNATALPTEQSPREMMDGGWTIVTRRSEGGIGTVITDQLCSDQDTPGSPRRSELCALIRLLPARGEDEWQDVPIERWAIESAQPLPDLASTVWPWPDVMPDDLSWQFNDEGVRCAIVNDPDWPYEPEETSNYPALTDGIFRRPLLPHESTCTEVFAWRTTLGMNDAMRLSPPGLSPNG